MARKNPDRVRSTVLTTRDGLFQPVLKYPDGTTERLAPCKPGTSLARAKEVAAAAAERRTAAGIKTSPKVKIEEAPDRKAMDEWLKVWNEDRVEIQNLTSTSDNMSHYNNHIGPLTEWAHVRDWTQDIMRKVSRGLSEKIRNGDMSGKTAVNVWSTATQICSDATEHDDDKIRCRDFDPSEKVRGPKRGQKLDKQALRPHELARFLACSDVPLLWRALMAVAVYTYVRDGELRVLRCRDVQSENQIIVITKAWNRRLKKIGPPKGKRNREVPIEPALAPLLEALKAGRSDDDQLFPCFPSVRDMSRGLKRWLRKAGVDRDELLNKSPTTKPITFHDARSTGILGRAVRNDPKFEIQVAAGHEKFSTTEGYMDLANRLRRGFGDMFQTLPPDLVEAARTLFPSAGVLDHKTDHAAE